MKLSNRGTGTAGSDFTFAVTVESATRTTVFNGTTFTTEGAKVSYADEDLVLKFTKSGSLTVDKVTTARILVIGGGGSGSAGGSSKYGYSAGGGKKAENTSASLKASTQYTITVGDGGQPSGKAGNDSKFSGSGFTTLTGSAGSAPTDTSSHSSAKAGSGGANLSSDITGTTAKYGTDGVAATKDEYSTAGGANTGDGGVGGYGSSVAGGAGGSGVVIVRVAKVREPVELDPVTVNIGAQKTVTVSDVTETAGTATSADTSIATVTSSQSGSTVTLTVTGVKAGNTTVTFDTDTKRYTMAVSVTEVLPVYTYKGRDIEYKNATFDESSAPGELIIKFTNTSAEGKLVLPEETEARLLVVGGGGSGGTGDTDSSTASKKIGNGGNGAGVEKDDHFAISAGTVYTITVGAGGAVRQPDTTKEAGYDGNPSSLSWGTQSITAVKGAGAEQDKDNAAKDGSGLNITSDITGNTVTYSQPGKQAPSASSDGTAGEANTGSGGWGCGNQSTYRSGKGADGIVVIRLTYRDSLFVKDPIVFSGITYGESLADSTWLSGSVTNAEGTVVSGTFAWTDTSVKPNVADGATNRLFNVTFTPEDLSTYSAVTFQATVTVTPAVLTATAAANPAVIVRGDAVPTYTVTYAGFVNGENESVVSPKATATSAYTTSSAAGTYEVTASGAGAANYTFNYVAGSLKVRDKVTVPAIQIEKTEEKAVVVDNVVGDLTVQPTSSATGVATVSGVSKSGTTLNFNVTGVSVGNATVTFETADAVYSLAVAVMNEVPKEDPAAATLKDNGTAPWSCTTTYAAKEWKVWYINPGSETESATSDYVTATVNPASSATAVTTTLTITGNKAGTVTVVLRGDNHLVKMITVTVSEADKDEEVTVMASEKCADIYTIAKAKQWNYQMDAASADLCDVVITRNADATATISIQTKGTEAGTATVQIYGDGELIKTITVNLTKKQDASSQTIYIKADTTWTYTTVGTGSSWTLESENASYASCEVQKNTGDNTATISITGISPTGEPGASGYKAVTHTIKRDGSTYMTITVVVRAAEETLSLACGASVDKSGGYAASSSSSRHWAYEGGDPEFDKVGLQILNGSTDLTATPYSGSKTCNYKHATSAWANDITMRLTAKQKVGTEVIKIGRWHENDSAAMDSYIYTVNVYDTATLNVTLDAGDTATLDCSSEIAAAWLATSENPMVATVEEFGDPSTTFKPVVTGLKQGTTKLTVKNDYRVYTVNVTVNAGTEVKSISVEKGQSTNETCSCTEAQTWTAESEAEGVATISVPGGSAASVQATISGVTVGDTVCNVYRSGRVGKPAYTYNVTVFERKERQAMLTIGKAETVTCQSELPAQWSATSSDPTVATVSDFGASDTIFKPVVTCLKVGTTELHIENAYVKYTYRVQVVEDVKKLALTVEKGKSIETNLTTTGSRYWSVSNQVGWTQATVTVDEGPAVSTTATVTGLKGGDSQWTVSLRSTQNDNELPAYILNIKVWESKTANLTLVDGETAALVCEAECPSAWTATSSDPCVTVTAQGASSTTFNPQITGAYEGTATVTVRNDYVFYTITVTVSSHYDQLRAAFADPDSVGNIFQLSQAITDEGEDEPLSIPAGKTLTLDLYGLRLALSRPIEVRGMLTIVNSIDATFFETLSSGRIISTGTGAVIYCYDGATLTLTKGLVGSFNDTTPDVGTQYGTAIVAEGSSEVTLGAQAQLCAKTLVSAAGTATVAIEGGEYRSGMIPFVFGGNAVGTMTGGLYADTTFADVTALATTNDTAQFTVNTGVCARVANFQYMRPLAADAAAQAVEGEASYNFRVVTAVASYNGYNYDSVSNAVTAASETTGSESAVKVLVDTDEKIVIPEGSTVTIDPNGKETGGVENNGTMDIKIPDEMVEVGSTQVVFTVEGTGTINAITTTDESKEVVYEKEGTTVTATVRTSADVLGQTKPDGEQSLTNKIDNLRAFLLANKVEAYTKAHTTPEEISDALNEKQEGTGENTLELWKDYALGITPTTSVQPVAKPEGDTATDGITLAMPEVAAAQDNQSGDYTITYEVVDEGDTKKTESSDAGSIAVPLETGKYKIKMVFTPKTK